ncbi:hypothetical protein [Sphingobacterium wenxiniae]|uniref:hypothetical protein n=1 Tax=Sphingobacterium wenxiniae TaxID=683125 RepID=UPI0011138F34|nr:hypothetical protein [Sphingobacterium wenxiniae]
MQVEEGDSHRLFYRVTVKRFSVSSKWRKDKGNTEGLCGRERHGNYCPKLSKELRTVVSAL